jgi:hypothetical protein
MYFLAHEFNLMNRISPTHQQSFSSYTDLESSAFFFHGFSGGKSYTPYYYLSLMETWYQISIFLLNPLST